MGDHSQCLPGAEVTTYLISEFGEGNGQVPLRPFQNVFPHSQCICLCFLPPTYKPAGASLPLCMEACAYPMHLYLGKSFCLIKR